MEMQHQGGRAAEHMVGMGRNQMLSFSAGPKTTNLCGWAEHPAMAEDGLTIWLSYPSYDTHTNVLTRQTQAPPQQATNLALGEMCSAMWTSTAPDPVQPGTHRQVTHLTPAMLE